MAEHQIVDAEAWLVARRELLDAEKAMTQAREALAEQRRALPWTPVGKEYEFVGESGGCTLSELFDGKDQLIVQHFMFGPDWDEGCPSCSLMADGHNQNEPHLAARGVAFAAVSRAPIEKLLAYRERMGWQFPWVSSLGSDFNFDFHVSFDGAESEQGDVFYNYRPSKFPSSEAPGISVFARDAAGKIFHTYSSYARGLDDFIMAYRFLDIVPKGRDEAALSHPMAWVRRHDQY